MIDIRHGDCLDLLRQMDDNSVDSIITDPPYGLNFMNKHWDYQLPDVAIWTECLRVLKPGGHMACFGSSRTHHRIWCAIEDAGFELRDTIMWIYGSGMSKGKNIGNGWNSQLKPAFEPILLARKNLSEKTIAHNVLKHKTGGINIDASRVPLAVNDVLQDGISGRNDKPMDTQGQGWGFKSVDRKPGLGRYPANVVLEDCNEVLEAFAQFGESKSSDRPRHNGDFKSVAKGHYYPHTAFGHSDQGSPARFFYCAKASKNDRAGSLHPTVKPVKLITWLTNLITPPGGIVLDPFAGSGTTGQAAFDGGFDAILMEREAEYVTDIRRRFELP